ncbi:hypothetical protein IWW46_004989, partial [Coemansia sp. RSA 2440]
MTDNAEPPALLDFDMGSSMLLHDAPSNDAVPHTTPKVVSKYDPVAQLMQSDSESSDSDIRKSIRAPSPHDTHDVDSGTDEKPQRKRKLLNRARFVKKADSVVGRLAPRRRAIDSDSSSSDSGSVAKPSRMAKAKTPQVNSDSDSDSDSNTAKPGRIAKAKTPKENSDSESDANPEVSPNSIIANPKPRMASAAALARIHQESERLIRETSVHLDPLDFTSRLILSEFYVKFDSHSTPKPTRAKFVMPPLKFSGSFAFGEGDDQVMVLDACDEVAFGSQRVRNVAKQKGGNALDAILERGSQSMHVEGGSLALKDLNEALLGVMHEKDRAERVEKEEKAAQKLKNKVERLQENGQDERVDSDDELVDADALLDAVAEDVDTDEDADIDEDVDTGSDGSGSEIEDNANTEPAVRGKTRAIVTSDEESGTEDAAPVAPARAKSQFIGMFRMPVREVPIQPADPHKERSQPPVRATPSQDMGMSQGPESQVMQDLFSSQSGCVNTQDSLLMTPDMATQRFGNVGECGLEFGTQPTQMEQVTQPTHMEQGTQPTQMEQVTQPTQLTALTGEADVSMLPTMVRRALDADPVQSGDEYDVKSRGSTPEHVSSANQLEPTEDPIEPTEPRQRGRLLRRQTSKPKPKRPKRSEFVEAEAEEDTSSDSDNDKPKSRKFNWGSNERPPESDESDYDMDSDEEQAALLADPMIDNTETSDIEGDTAIRQLHRKQHYEDDERDIHELFRDVTTGGLRTRRTKFSLGDDEDYNDRQTRAERMEQRKREMNKMRRSEICDTSLKEIAKHPETAAFARAALMRGDDTDDDGEGDVGELEEEVDDHKVAAAVRSRLVRRVSYGSDSESADSRKMQNVDAPSSSANSILSDTMDGDVFGSVPIEQMIIRRKTLRAVDTSTSSSAWNPRPPLPQTS